MAEVMIEVKEARKAFGQDVVLNGLDMTVMRNTIYGLLGPSGCGKTILINCILGRKYLDSGSIFLGVRGKSDIGYMPQEVALFAEFTIKEIFIFYGRLFGMNALDVKKKSCELRKVLELPNWENRIGSLSGGEQRRVSFAVALIHDPKLLLLDEPTVGVDPLLSHNMWQYLLNTTSQGKTVVITTHYVEEARQAHTIGLMRSGELLCQDSPTAVMISQRSSTLEGAFLELSRKQEESQLDRVTKIKQTDPLKSPPPLHNGDIFSWYRFSAQLIKNVNWIKRNRLMMLFLMLLPAMQAFFFCTAFGQHPTSLKVFLVSDELAKMSPQGVERHKACSNTVGHLAYTATHDLNCSLASPFTCQYYWKLKESLDVELNFNMDMATQGVLKNKGWAVIYVPTNFSESVLSRLYFGMRMNESLVNLHIDQSTIFVEMDMSNYIIANQLKQAISENFADFLFELSSSCGLPKDLMNTPIRFNDPIFGTKDPVYAHTGLPGFFCSFCFYFTMMFTSGSIMMEKLIGLLDRSIVAGLTYFEVITAHLAVQFVLMTVQKSLMLVIFYFIYNNPMLGNILLIICLLFAVEIVGIAYGFLLTEIFSSDRLISYAGIGATLAIFSLAGIIWPMEGAHEAIRSLVWMAPVAPAVESYKSISMRGYGLHHPIVSRGFTSCICWTVALGLATVLVAKAKKALSSI